MMPTRTSMLPPKKKFHSAEGLRGWGGCTGSSGTEASARVSAAHTASIDCVAAVAVVSGSATIGGIGTSGTGGVTANTCDACDSSECAVVTGAPLSSVLTRSANCLTAPSSVAIRASAAQQALRERGYVPSEIRIAPFERIGARLFAANVYFSDHSNEEMQASRYQAVTVESVIRFLEQSREHIAQIQVVKLP